MLRSLDAFCTHLAATPASQVIQTTEWIIPAVQTVHIVCVASVMSAMLMVDLRLARLRSRDESLAAVARRYLPFVWYALPILLATGATLIIAEPARSLENPVFFLKMGLLLLACAITLAFQIPLRRDAEYFERSPARRRLASVAAYLSLPLWIAVLFAGRWIAYVQSN